VKNLVNEEAKSEEILKEDKSGHFNENKEQNLHDGTRTLVGKIVRSKVQKKWSLQRVHIPYQQDRGERRR